MFGSINNCHNVKDFRKLAKKKLKGEEKVVSVIKIDDNIQ